MVVCWQLICLCLKWQIIVIYKIVNRHIHDKYFLSQLIVAYQCLCVCRTTGSPSLLLPPHIVRSTPSVWSHRSMRAEIHRVIFLDIKKPTLDDRWNEECGMIASALWRIAIDMQLSAPFTNHQSNVWSHPYIHSFPCQPAACVETIGGWQCNYDDNVCSMLIYKMKDFII